MDKCFPSWRNILLTGRILAVPLVPKTSAVSVKMCSSSSGGRSRSSIVSFLQMECSGGRRISSVSILDPKHLQGLQEELNWVGGLRCVTWLKRFGTLAFQVAM